MNLDVHKGSENQEMDVYEFYSLGLGDPIGISAVNRLSFGELLDRITEGFPEQTEEESEDIIRTADKVRQHDPNYAIHHASSPSFLLRTTMRIGVPSKLKDSRSRFSMKRT